MDWQGSTSLKLISVRRIRQREILDEGSKKKGSKKIRQKAELGMIVGFQRIHIPGQDDTWATHDRRTGMGVKNQRAKP